MVRGTRDTRRGHTEEENLIGAQSSQVVEDAGRSAEHLQSTDHALEVLGTLPDPDVEILREPRLGVDAHGPAANHEVLSVRIGQCRQQIPEIREEIHVCHR